ncbi:MAG TPA: hypothetical protein VG710_14695, partial [Opitutus sp.]|nr:hypothetical protein [Opitutus sp.]
MFIRRIKFLWGSSEVIQARWRLGLVGFYAHRPGFPGTGLAISVRGLLRWTLGLALGGYVGGAAVLGFWFRRQPRNLVRFSDVLTWPARQEHMRDLRGRMWIAQARDALAAGRFGEGLFLLGRGLAAAPEDYAARKELADIYLVTGQRLRA